MELAFTTKDFCTVTPILLCLVAFIAYWFVAESQALKVKFQNKYGEDNYTIHLVWFQKVAGFILLGVVPALLAFILLPYSIEGYGLYFSNPTKTLLVSFGLGVIAVIVNLMIARKEENLKTYPQIRAKYWTKSTLIKNGVGWGLYLLGYEFLFRGVLFFALLPVLDFWAVVSINVALYSATHLPKGQAETIAAIPFGFIICLVSYYTGNFWAAFFIHLCIALSNSYTALYFHPDMKLISNKNKVIS